MGAPPSPVSRSIRVAVVKTRARWALALAVATLAAPRFAVAEPTSTGWVLTNARGGKAISGAGYRLFNVYNKQHLVVRPGKAPSVDTSPTAPYDVEIVTARGGELRCGEPFSLRVAGYNLVLEPKSGAIVPTTDRKAEEWKLLGCARGVVALGQPLALVNVKRGDAWVGCKHHGAIAYCWDDKQLMGIATE